ncbi:thiolase family protein [Streptomyces sp. NPDC059766]|uniref:thiolase family protein n=1 Tax=Streptomyces sp. NPDC059766 TaxID=3346940 RepID=UPI0036522F43
MARKHNVAVTGIGHSRILRRPDVPLGKLAVEAAETAIADAGLKISDIDGVICTPSVPFDMDVAPRDGHHFVSADLMITALGLRPRWGLNHQRMVAQSMIEAVHALEAGVCDYALVVRALHNPAGSYGHTSTQGAKGTGQFRLPYGQFYPGTWGQMWHRYRDRYNSGSREQMASFVIRSREHGLLNPDSYWAQYKPEPLTMEKYLAGATVASPLTLFDCDIPIQGAAAFVLTRDDRAQDGPNAPAYVLGVSNPPVPLPTDLDVYGLDEEEQLGARTAEVLWADAGLGPADVDVANLYDGFSFIAMVWLEAMGFCGRGEAFEFVQGERTSLTGKLPLNTGGGNLGAGRMHGVAHLMDSIRQVSRRAGAAQVADADVALAVVGPQKSGGAVLFGAQRPD